MAKAESAKEEIGWLKVAFAVFAAVDASLLAWLAQTYSQGAGNMLLVFLATWSLPHCQPMWHGSISLPIVRFAN